MPSAPDDYYDRNAQAYFDETIGVDMDGLYQRFLPLLPSAAHILDAGCGSGRDSRAFRERGYQVTAFDASPPLAGFAEVRSGLPVQCMRFQDIDWCRRFDGIWACASLSHVPAAELPDVLRRLVAALKPEGILYASFKYGRGEREHQGRCFTDLTEAGLDRLLAPIERLAPVEVWTTCDLRPERGKERWLNKLLRRTD